MLRPGGQKIDPGGLDGAVAQHVRQLCNIPTDLVKGRGEQAAIRSGVNLRFVIFKPSSLQSMIYRPRPFRAVFTDSGGSAQPSGLLSGL